MTREEAILELRCHCCETPGREAREAINVAIEALKQPERKTGEWKRMSDLPAEQDDRYECSSCGNVVHYKDRILLNTFNDFCGRCGSYNGFKFKE